MTSYLTEDFVEEKDGCSIGQRYVQMYIVRGR